MAESQSKQTAGGSGLPIWTLPIVIVIIIGVLILVSRKYNEAVENPLVEFAILTVGVFAFAAAFRFIAIKSGWPGLAIFFGGTPTKD